MLFDAKLFSDVLTRKDLQAVEDYIASEFHSGIDSAVRLKAIIDRHAKSTNKSKNTN